MLGLLIKGGRMVDPANGIDEILDIFIENGTIARFGKGLAVDGAESLDASGLVAAPGLSG